MSLVRGRERYFLFLRIRFFWSLAFVFDSAAKERQEAGGDDIQQRALGGNWTQAAAVTGELSERPERNISTNKEVMLTCPSCYKGNPTPTDPYIFFPFHTSSRLHHPTSIFVSIFSPLYFFISPTKTSFLWFCIWQSDASSLSTTD